MPLVFSTQCCWYFFLWPWMCLALLLLPKSGQDSDHLLLPSTKPPVLSLRCSPFSFLSMEHPRFVIIPLAISKVVVLGWFGQDNFGQELFLLAWISLFHFSCVVAPDDVIFGLTISLFCHSGCRADHLQSIVYFWQDICDKSYGKLRKSRAACWHAVVELMVQCTMFRCSCAPGSSPPEKLNRFLWREYGKELLIPWNLTPLLWPQGPSGM